MNKAKNYDPYQLEAIRAEGCAIVSAGAGSGKTTVLSARYLRLVKEKEYPVDSILALTFTKKATSEMYGRIHQELAKEESPFVRAQLESFGDAQISTLDSFCARVSRSGCSAWGFSPDFAVDDGLALEMAEKEALGFLLDEREEPTARLLIARHGFERVYREIFAKASLRMCPACPLDFLSMPAKLESFLRSELARARLRLSELRSAALEPDSGAGKALLDILARPLPEADNRDFLALCETLAGVTCVRSGLPFHEESRELKDSVCKTALAAGWSLGSLPDYVGLYSLLDRYQERVIAAKRSANVLSFLDSARMAKQVLVSDPELRAYYKSRFRSVMIDEFQDDNQLQRDILFLLAEEPGRMGKSVPGPESVRPDKLFFVGDEKQSIYRFRGADVSVFRRLSRELGGAAKSIELGMNYRSEPRLIEFFNGVFASVMESPERDFEARYLPIGAREAKEGIRPAILRLSYEPPEDDGGEPPLSGKECEAWGIAEFIRESVAGGKRPLMVPGDDGKPRPAEYGDFAVLFRTTTHQEKLERFLRLLGLPFASTDLCAFFRDAPTNDMYAAMRAALYPRDRGALAAFLRSPFASLSDGALVGLLSDPGFADWRSLAEYGAETLEGDDAEKAGRAMEVLRTVSGMADAVPISRIVAYLWYEAGYRDFILARELNHAYLEYFDFLFGLADDADKEGRTLAAFVEELEGRIAEGERLKEKEPPREAAGGVRLMTVHKAKGLEFPVVILPGIEATGAEQEGKELAHWWRDEVLTVKMSEDGRDPRNFFFNSCEEERKAMAAAELKRLLYVACTRAECHLAFSECVPSKRDEAGRSMRTVLDSALSKSGAESMVERRPLRHRTLAEYFRLVGSSGRSGPGPREAIAAAGKASVLDRPPSRREFTATELNAAYAASRGLPGRPAEGAPEDGAPYGGEAVDGAFGGPVFGSLAHAFIQAELDGRDAPPVLPPALRAAVESQPDPAAFSREARRVAGAFLDSELRRAIDRASWRRAEHPFLLRKEGPNGEYFVSGAIDLIAVVDGECLVVDYKTDVERVDGEYDLQMSLYREAAAALTGTARARSFLFYLRAGGAVEAVSDPDPGPFLLALTGLSRL